MTGSSKSVLKIPLKMMKQIVLSNSFHEFQSTKWPKKQNTNLYIFIWYHKFKHVTFVLKKPVIILILLSNSFQKVFMPEIKAKFFEIISQEIIFKGTNMNKFTVFYLRKLQILLKKKKCCFKKHIWNCKLP